MATIIFDFDGTIADSFDYVVDFLSRQAKRPQLSAAEKKKLRGLSMPEAARELGHHRSGFVNLFFAGRREMGKNIGQIEPVKGMPETIARLAADGHELFIVTNNSAKNVEKFLEHHGLRRHFVGIHGNAWLLGKRRSLARVARRQKTAKKVFHYIGDEPKDISAGLAAAATIIAVAWGFANREKLQALKPSALVSSPAEILKIIKK